MTMEGEVRGQGEWGPVAVLGAGLTGASWAGLFAAHGLEVRLYDRDPRVAERARARAAESARFLAAQGLAAANRVEHGLGLLRAVADPEEAFAGVHHVQECVSEDLDHKRQAFALAGRYAAADALLATSSSGLSISSIQEGLSVAERCLAAHPYNPPHLVPLVELAAGRDTAPGVLPRAVAFYRAVGKEPVVVRADIPGYIANRLSAALWREAVELVRMGVASVDDVDSAVRDGPGLRWAVMGPHLLYHLGGGEGGIRGHLDHLASVKEGMLRDLATWTEFPPDTAAVLEVGLAEEIDGAALEDLAAERDLALAAILRARRAMRRGPGATADEVDPKEGGGMIVDGSTAQPVPVSPGAVRATLVQGERSTLVRFDIEPGGSIPPHDHLHEQTGFLVSGDLTLHTAEAEWAVRPGDAWSLPGGIPHGARSQGGAVAVEVFVPCRDEYLPGATPRPPWPGSAGEA